MNKNIPRTIVKVLAAAYVATVVIVVCAASIHAATVTIPAYPAPPTAAQQQGKAHQTITAVAAEPAAQVLQPLWVADTAAVDKPGEIYTITGYCPCITCCGIWSADHPSRQGTDYQQLTASGTVPTAGRTAGADWATLPPGTVIEIEGYGRRVVEDKPADWVVDRYGGKIIDLYFDSHAEAAEEGRREVLVRRVSE